MSTAISISRPYGITLLRILLGSMFLAHFFVKFFAFGPAGTIKFFSSIGLPAWLALATMTAELTGGTALVLGVRTRLVALMLVPLLLGTIITVHGHNGFSFSNPKGGWEYPAVWVILLIVQALLGDGPAALLPMPLPDRWTYSPDC